ncbi:ATP-binding protein [Streptomyces antimicrobicus]|uniref:Regulator n=1 Tax=Streptomyces antimicrobicus TaxID=2883108 RepID=A0ABS8BDL4_9ACTN|nr:NB-ARC domain-containing protein [Streptomyces antimicrobicus]MCB5182700.1 regulator [Streptomyces antimicrobicus]
MQGNLPPEAASFVGRAREVAVLDGLLRRNRLVTLTGVGGVGKSRLALRTVRGHSPAPGDGTWWVELSPLRDPALLAATVAHTLGLSPQSARSDAEELCGWMTDKELLLVLDTCEHLVSACRHLVGDLLQSAPGLTVLVTSREPLGCPGELLMDVRPLPADGPGSDAVALLRDRALAASPEAASAFADPVGARLAAVVCRRLDGLPLALELAGARMRRLPLAELARRLDGRLEVLCDADPALPPRHRMLRTAIGWSHELCAPVERLLWARLSVFAGGFDLAAARAVCAGGPLPAPRVAGVLDGLVAKSVVRRADEPGTGTRYRMLDTVREYGQGWLAELGEGRTVTDRHAYWYAALAEAAEREWLGPGQVDWHRRMTADHMQLRAALEHLLRTDAVAALEMAGALWFLWFSCGHAHEGKAFLERALAAGPRAGAAYERAVWALGLTCLLRGELDEAVRWGLESTQAARRLADPERELRAAYLTGVSLLMAGDPHRALELAGPRARAAHGGQVDGVGWLLCRLATAYALSALERFEEAAQEARALREACAALGERWLRAYADYVLSSAALGLGRPGEALRHVRAMLAGKQLMGDRVGIAVGLDLQAAAVAAQGDGERAARLLGTGHAWWRTVGRPQLGSPSLTALRDRGERQARAAVGDAAYERAFASAVRDGAVAPAG